MDINNLLIIFAKLEFFEETPLRLLILRHKRTQDTFPSHPRTSTICVAKMEHNGHQL